jgi:hypothetical protein
MREVRPEKTGWRDRDLSLRHREWGYDAPFADFDWVCVEYDMHKVMGLFDYKNETAEWPPDQDRGKKATLDALRDMADKGHVPFFVVRYKRPFSWFEPYCWSNVAHMGWSSYHGRRMSEFDYVTFVYKLRARTVPSEIASRLSRSVA